MSYVEYIIIAVVLVIILFAVIKATKKGFATYKEYKKKK